MKGPPAQQLRDLRLSNPLVRGAMRRGEEKMAGAMCGIDAVGYQAKDFGDPSHERVHEGAHQARDAGGAGGALRTEGLLL